MSYLVFLGYSFVCMFGGQAYSGLLLVLYLGITPDSDSGILLLLKVEFILASALSNMLSLWPYVILLYIKN